MLFANLLLALLLQKKGGVSQVVKPVFLKKLTIIAMRCLYLCKQCIGLNKDPTNSTVYPVWLMIIPISFPPLICPLRW